MFLLIAFICCVLLVVFRIAGVIYFTIFEQRKTNKRKEHEQIKTVIVIGSGGHTTEMMCLIEAMDPARYTPRIYVMASSDTWSENKIQEYEDTLQNKGCESKHEVIKIPRSRKVHQSYVTSVFTTLYSILAVVPVMLQSNPDLVLCNGPGTCIPVCVVAFLMRCFFISDNKIIFIESICRVKTLSLSGKILQYFADEILVQWPEMTDVCRRGKYLGRLL